MMLLFQLLYLYSEGRMKRERERVREVGEVRRGKARREAEREERR
jgi:hypothetical protein